MSKSSPAHETAHRGACWHVLRMIVLLVLCWTAISSGPFNLREATDQLSRDVFYRAWSVAYPTNKSPKSLVVLFDETSLGADGYWPAPYASHASLIQALLPLRPRAIFVDIAFVDARPDETIQNLVRVIRVAAAQGVKVFQAAASSSTGVARTLRRELVQLAEEGLLLPVSIDVGSISGQNPAYPAVPNADGLPPAAIALYKDFCLQHQRSDCFYPSDARDFELWWPAPPSYLNCQRAIVAEKNPCDEISRNPWVRLARLFTQSLLSGFLSKSQLELDPIHVPYTPTVLWQDILERGLSDEMQGHIRDSYVFYGANVALAKDEIYTSVYGLDDGRHWPGVHAHAIAFDNLVTLGGNVIRRDLPFQLPATLLTLLMLLLCCLAVLLKQLTFQKFRLELNFLQIDWLGAPLDWLVFGATSLALAWGSFSWLHQSPVNWIGLVVSWVFVQSLDQVGFSMKVSDWLHGIFRILYK